MLKVVDLNPTQGSNTLHEKELPWNLICVALHCVSRVPWSLSCHKYMLSRIHAEIQEVTIVQLPMLRGGKLYYNYVHLA